MGVPVWWPSPALDDCGLMLITGAGRPELFAHCRPWLSWIPCTTWPRAGEALLVMRGWRVPFACGAGLRGSLVF